MFNTGTRELATLEESYRLLVEAESLSEIKAIRDRADTVRIYAKLAGCGLDVRNRASELKLRAERKAGFLLGSLKLRGGDRRSMRSSSVSVLDHLGISRKQSSRWQQLAAITEAQFNGYIMATHKQNREITTAGLLRLARSEQSDAAILYEKAELGPAYAKHDAEAAQEKLEELENHVRLLADILRPIYEMKKGELKTGERRVVGRLLQEMSGHIAQLRNAWPSE